MLRSLYLYWEAFFVDLDAQLQYDGATYTLAPPWVRDKVKGLLLAREHGNWAKRIEQSAHKVISFLCRLLSHIPVAKYCTWSPLYMKIQLYRLFFLLCCTGIPVHDIHAGRTRVQVILYHSKKKESQWFIRTYVTSPLTPLMLLAFSSSSLVVGVLRWHQIPKTNRNDLPYLQHQIFIIYITNGPTKLYNHINMNDCMVP